MRIVFMGTGEICLPTLRWLLDRRSELPLVAIYTQPDKPVGRKQILTASPVKSAAKEAAVPVFQPELFRKDTGAVRGLEELRPDLVVVMAYGQILPRGVIAAPSRACVNLHASLLPRHRGASPVQAAIREGDERTGITLMHVAPKLDSGDMILKESLPVLPHDTGGSLHDRLADLGPLVMARGLSLFERGDPPSEPQDESLVTYSGKLVREDGLVDWTEDAPSIERLVRAYDPWPGTYSTLELGGKSRKLKIYPPVTPLPDAVAPPGAIAARDGALVVACGEGSVRLAGDVQLEGRRRLAASDFLRGVEIPEGSVFGRR